jgi:hypothetical protein
VSIPITLFSRENAEIGQSSPATQPAKQADGKASSSNDCGKFDGPRHRNRPDLIASLGLRLEIKGAMIAELIPQRIFLNGGRRTIIPIQNLRK